MARPLRYGIKRHVQELEKVLFAAQDKVSLNMLREYAVHDTRLLYKMAARFLPFSPTENQELISGFILAEKDGEDTISEDGENEVEQLTNVLLVRASNFKEVHEFISAAELAFAVILAVEPEIPNVYDEGWTYQTILNDAFEFLTNMAEEIENVKVIEKLYEMTLDHFENRDADDSHWEHKFEELLETLNKRL